ncbi:MAG: DUF2950 domain-containing protein, partial [Candidatus Acidiferrales bacterium]
SRKMVWSQIMTACKFTVAAGALLLCASASVVGAPAHAPQSPTNAAQTVFSTPQAAADALVVAAAQPDSTALLNLLGPGGADIVKSGDPAQDRSRLDHFSALAKESLSVEPDPNQLGRFIVYVGSSHWPLPIPIVPVKSGETTSYRFDAAGAKSEILARRVGRNELDAIAFLRAFDDAEMQFAYTDVNRNGMRDYAEQLRSDPGERDGLYWDDSEGAPESPLAPIIEQAIAEGYELPPSGEPFTLHGYVFRVLKGQGSKAPGGARDYVVQGDMIGGFAMIAYPTDYAVTGVKTFVVNQDGIVYEKDLGPSTSREAAAIKLYNPDKSWSESPVELDDSDATATAPQ